MKQRKVEYKKLNQLERKKINTKKKKEKEEFDRKQDMKLKQIKLF